MLYDIVTMEGKVTLNRKEQRRVGVLVEVEKGLKNREAGGRSEGIWYIKHLSGNDALANGTHQAGPYVPKEFLFSIFPALNRPETDNPDVWFELCVDSHSDCRKVRAVWYNNKLRGGTRNEARITQLGGSSSALLDPESTGTLAIFAFLLKKNREAESCRVWVCRNETEADIVEEKIGPVEPGTWAMWTPAEANKVGIIGEKGKGKIPGSCWLSLDQIPASWLEKFPSGAEIIERAVALCPETGVSVDRRLLKRRECEYEVFRSVEEALELPHIM